jgi:hypothetical protein
MSIDDSFDRPLGVGEVWHDEDVEMDEPSPDNVWGTPFSLITRRLS